MTEGNGAIWVETTVGMRAVYPLLSDRVERFCKYFGYLFMQLLHNTAMEPTDIPGKHA